MVSAEHPYRERFRAQLMLALYRCGRQAEGLDVYRQTRKLLNSELGLEPGVELQELERAILTQDPTLSVAAESAARLRDPVRLVCPFKGLEPFETSDAEFFFGRERLVAELVARLDVSPFLAIIGPSGSGKSSLLRAGLLAALDRWPHLLLRPGAEPVFEPPAGRPARRRRRSVRGALLRFDQRREPACIHRRARRSRVGPRAADGHLDRAAR